PMAEVQHPGKTRYPTRSYSQWNWCDLSSLQNRPRDLTVLASDLGTVGSQLQQAHTSPSFHRPSRPSTGGIGSALNRPGNPLVRCWPESVYKSPRPLSATVTAVISFPSALRSVARLVQNRS